jgi:hypothetical protein
MLLDAGALIALDRNERPMWQRLTIARRRGLDLVTHAGVLGQVWRRARQARLAQAVGAIDVKPLDADLGKRAGILLAATRTNDVIDAALVLLSRDGDRLYTGDTADFLRLAAAADRDIEIVRP